MPSVAACALLVAGAALRLDALQAGMGWAVCQAVACASAACTLGSAYVLSPEMVLGGREFGFARAPSIIASAASLLLRRPGGVGDIRSGGGTRLLPTTMTRNASRKARSPIR